MVFSYLEKFYSDSEYLHKVFRQAKNEVKTELGEQTASSHNRILYFKKFFELLNETDICRKALECYSMYNHTFMRSMRCYDFVYPLLNFCKKKNIKVCICTDMMCEIQIKKLMALGITDKIDYIVTSEEVGVEKPNTKMYSKVMSLVGDNNASHYMFIGDSEEKDVIGPRSIGMNSMNVEELLKL